MRRPEGFHDKINRDCPLQNLSLLKKGKNNKIHLKKGEAACTDQVRFTTHKHLGGNMLAKYLLPAVMAVSTAVSALEPLDFLSPEVESSVDFKILEDQLSLPLSRVDSVLMKAGAFASALRQSDPATADAVTKRIEIARRLKAYIEARRNGSAEMRILAWQGAQELKVLLDYFEFEERFQAEKKALPAPKVFSVKDFGAVGDGRTDDGPAFRKAIAAATSLAGKPAVIKIPSGNYFIKPDTAPLPKEVKVRLQEHVYSERYETLPGKYARTHLMVQNVKNLTLQGEKGAVLVFSDPTMNGLRLAGCRNCQVKDLVLDWARNTSTQGTVTAVEPDPFALIFEPDSGYPAPDEDYFLKATARRFTPSRPDGLFGAGTTRMGEVEKLASNRFRLKPQAHDMNSPVWRKRKAGDRISIIARYDASIFDASALDMRYCAFNKMENVVVWRSPGCAYRAFRNYALQILRCRIEPGPGRKDLVTSNADGCQTTGMIGPYIAQCRFSYMEDDGFNIHSSSPALNDVPRSNTTRPFLSQGGFLISGLTGELKAFLQPVPGGKPFYRQNLPEDAFSSRMVKRPYSYYEMEALNLYGGRAHMLRERPDRLTMIPGDLTGTIVKDTAFFNIRGMAMQITAPNVLVEGCTIRHMNSFGINVSALLPWGMTFNPHNVVVRNTKLTDVANPAFSMRYRGLGQNGFSKPRFINDILIENCDFEQKTWCSVEVRNASDVTIRNCRFKQTRESINKDIHVGVIVCDNFGDLKLENNRFEILNPEKYLPVKVVQPSEEGKVAAKGSVVKKHE